MKKHFFRDELQKLVFPWLTPHPVSNSADVGYFQETITEQDYLIAAKRNQVGFNIIYNVAQDAVTCGFRCVDDNEEVLHDFDKQVSKLYLKEIEKSLLNAFASARLYGSAGILIGFVKSRNLSLKRIYGSRVNYLYALPETLIRKKNPKEDAQGQTEFPLELANYELKSYNNGIIDGSRLVHLQPFTIEPDLDGTSVLESVYDLLTVLKNADWSVGQNIFRHSSGLTFITPGDGASQEQIDAIRDVTENTNAKSIVTLIPGCSTTSVPASTLNPGQYYDVLMGQISAGCNIPVSILTGAQSGQGVSENDRRDYADFLTGIQKSCLTPALKEILNIYQESTQLPKQEFEIRWNSRSIFMIEAARAKLYNARSEVEKEKKRETEAKASLFSARADYWKALGERKQETYEEAKELEEKEEEEEERTNLSLSKKAAEIERGEEEVE
jgi:hypothetical protein